MEAEGFRAGLIALVGRPNVGKSTLLNALVGRKVSIVTHKPQTTRHRIMGVRHEAGHQFVFVDTPGIHLNAKRALNRTLNKSAQAVLDDVDLVVLVVEALRFTEEDDHVLRRLRGRDNVVLVINKVDQVKDKDALLPFIAGMSERMNFAAVVPLSALKTRNLEPLLDELRARLPESPPLFPEEQLSDRDERFMVAEIVREKLMERLHEELPYSLTVTVDQMTVEPPKGKGPGLVRIGATIWVEREGQKAIVIGEGGSMLRTIGRMAREELETRFGRKVFLELWVKQREGWADDPRQLRQLGIDEQ
ncbi:MAG TPA: GTPase Era [Gammaproteobacteria bacterium]|nr:GTPase Era [Gammaproteobacteria bacterium]